MLVLSLILYGALAFGTIIGITYLIVEMPDKKRKLQNELNKLNQLYECKECNKYHRKYQEKIKELSDENYKKVQSGKYKFENGELIKLDEIWTFTHDSVCPHCYHETTWREFEEYEWTKYHPDCPELDKKKYKTYLQALDDINRIAYEERSMNKFVEMNKLI